jgi:hypothetical protein
MRRQDEARASLDDDHGPPSFATEEMNVRQTIKLGALLFACTLGTGCVSSGTYNAKVTELDKAMKDQDALK